MKTIASALFVMLAGLSVSSNAFAYYLEPLGGSVAYGCEYGTRTVFSHNKDGTNTKLSKKKTNSLLAKFKNDIKKAKLYRDMKACVDGKLKFRSPCSVIAPAKASSVNSKIISGRLCLNDSPSVVKVTITSDYGSSNCTGVVVHPKVVLTSAHCFPLSSRHDTDLG